MKRLAWVRGVLVAATLSPAGEALALACVAPCAVGQECDGGVCVCDTTSCPSGCCDSTGACQPGNTDAVCGAGGMACMNCPYLWFCTLAQVCAPDCGMKGCNGCCVGQTSCVNSSNQTDSVCGVGGNTCGYCPTGTTCVQNPALGGGTCQFADGGVVVVDGGLPSDAGTSSDGGASGDGGAFDGGASTDGGASGGDGAMTGPSASRANLGCGCSGSGALFALALLGLLISLARRR